MKKLLSIILTTALMFSMAGCNNGTAKSSSDKNSESTTTSMSSLVDTSSKNDTKKEITEITFWHAMGGKNEAAIQKITEDFMVKRPDIKVNLVNQGGYMDLFDKLMASAKAAQLPNIAQIYSNRLSWYVSKNLVEDLTPYMNAPKTGFTKDDYDDIPKMFFDDGIWNKKQYAIPFNKSMMVLYYNKGMLDEAAVSVPKTWDEWVTASEKLTKDTDGDGNPDIYGTVFANNLSTDIAPWLKQAGGSTMNEETNELHFDTPETKEAVTFLNKLFQNKSARFAGEDKNANVPVQQGRAAMCVASTSALPYIEEGTMEGIKIEAAALPTHKTNDQLYYGTNVTVFASGNPEQKQASWDYIKFLTSTENTAYFAAQTGYIPVRKSAKNDPVFEEVLKAKPIKQLCFDNMDNGFQGTRNIGGKNALDELGTQLDLVFSGEKGIDSALKDAQANGTKAMEEARNN